jgi:hypothetical protein
LKGLLPFDNAELLKSSCEATQSTKNINREEAENKLTTMTDDMFRSEESKAFLLGEDKASLLRQSREQLTVLRGSAVNLFLLSILCFFGLWYELSLPATPAYKSKVGIFVLRGLTLLWRKLPAILVILLPIVAIHQSQSHNALEDPPVMEGVLIGFGVIGLFARHMRRRRSRYVYPFLISLSLFLLVFGGWMKTTVSHAQLVIYTYSALHK